MSDNNYNFLQEISRVIEMFNRHRKQSGEDFNIFSVMSMESDEVFTHSALLAELLNPSGSHGLGSAPLKLFVHRILGKEYPMDFSKAYCNKEEHIGFTNSSKSEGGRIDIIVKDLIGNIIIIENKIYAVEQTRQLERYKNNYPDAELFYLTLDGKDSEQPYDTIENEKIYKNISYEEDIIIWILECAKLAFDKPMLREVLNQYVYLLKKLTNKTTNLEMAENVNQIIRQNFESSLEIYRNFKNVSKALKNELLLEILETLVSEFNSLEIVESVYRDENAFQISGFPNGEIVHFRFKSDKFSVLSFSTTVELQNEQLLKNFKKDAKPGSLPVYWKILGTIQDEDMFANILFNTKTKYASEISKTLNLLLGVEKLENISK